MSDYIITCIGILLLGMLVGGVIKKELSITEMQYTVFADVQHHSEALCSENKGIKQFCFTRRYYKVICNNGASFNSIRYKNKED